MSFISSIQSFLPLPRPENRSRVEIERDLEDEIGFHLEMKTRSLMSQHAGVKREDASAVAKKKFGDVEAIKSQCRSIALKERIMLQRVNFIMMVVVMLMVVGVGLQVLITQRYNTLALQAITTDLANMKFTAGPAARVASDPGVIYVDGDVQQPGTFALPQSGALTLRRAIAIAGGVKGRDVVKVVVWSGDEGASSVRYSADRFELAAHDGDDFVLTPDDLVVVSAIVESGARQSPLASWNGLPADSAGLWQQGDAEGRAISSGASLDMMGPDDVRNLSNWPAAVLSLSDARKIDLNFNPPHPGGTNLQIKPRWEGRGISGRWEYRDGKLLLNIMPAVPEITEPLAFVHVGTDTAKSVGDARAAAVGDFVVRLFATADPHDPNPSQTVRNFLDEEEKTIDERYADDPASAGMIKELIAARRKILDVDAGVHPFAGNVAAAHAEAQAKAVSEFLQNVLTSADSHPPAMSVKDVLDKAEARIATDFANNPEVAARLRETIDTARKNMAADKAAPERAGDQGEVRQDDDQFPKVSAFRAVHWKDEWTPIVNYNGQWYELASIEGIESRAIVERCRQYYGDDLARKRFSEDMAQMLMEMGHVLAADMRVRLQIKDLPSGTMIAVGEAETTPNNREQIVKDNAAAESADRAYPVWDG